MLVAYSCQQNLFPIYQELQNKNNKELKMSFFIGCMLVLILYVVLGTISLYMFGSELHSTILWNIGHECVETKARCPTQSYVLRIMFLVVIVCHIPFIFFSGKEAMLIIIDEI
jgi:amino acid permease